MTWGWASRKRITFRPRLTIEHTGYSGPVRWQWCVHVISKRGQPMSWGQDLVGQTTPSAQATEACRILRRMGAVPKGGEA